MNKNNKRQRQNISQLATARGFLARSQRGLFYLSGPAKLDGVAYDEARAFLTEYQTSREIAREGRVAEWREARRVREAREPGKTRPANKYFWPIFDPENGESPPDDLVGLHVVSVMLPPGADGDEALRGLWLNEDAAKRRGCPAVAARIDDARELIASGTMRGVRIVVSDHDLASVAAYGADIRVVMLASYLAGAVLVRGKHGPRGKRDAVIHN
jgi:hypothetical protein